MLSFTSHFEASFGLQKLFKRLTGHNSPSCPYDSVTARHIGVLEGRIIRYEFIGTLFLNVFNAYADNNNGKYLVIMKE
jgi:hypothetical protein